MYLYAGTRIHAYIHMYMSTTQTTLTHFNCQLFLNLSVGAAPLRAKLTMPRSIVVIVCFAENSFSMLRLYVVTVTKVDVTSEPRTLSDHELFQVVFVSLCIPSLLRSLHQQYSCI